MDKLPLARAPHRILIQFDTGSGDFFVFGKNCGSPACNNHSKYDPDVDKTFSPINGKNFSIKYADGAEISGDSGETTIIMAGLTIEAQEFGLADEVSDNFTHPFEGVMGMGFSKLSVNGQTPPITNLIKQSPIIDKPQFSFLLGRETSELIIGGSNPDRYRADTLTFTVLSIEFENSLKNESEH
ncbi:6017_t:CDS:2 [Gigaspora margarita]|uniref:6017_t:CDS:1 n=1 Tax=Gigaspora margarita TaxID=4874 RepID=A0ABM8VXJ9_GIGMA|nr:6017_t:CDS:2 [Gigaspora margarita]